MITSKDTRLRNPIDSRVQSVGRVRRGASPSRDYLTDNRPLSTPAGSKWVTLSQHALTQVDDRQDFSSMVRKVKKKNLNVFFTDFYRPTRSRK